MKLSDYDSQVREALEERGVTDERLANMSARDVLDEVLNWEGIHGFTGLICRTLLQSGATIPERGPDMLDDDKLRELRKAVNANLTYVYSGQAARDKEKLSAQRKAERIAAKRRDKRLISLPKKIKAIRAELANHDEFYHQCEHDENPLGYAEGMTPAQHQGLMEEIDSAREGCLAELIDLEDELRRLQGD